jgi:hypothetical protein
MGSRILIVYGSSTDTPSLKCPIFHSPSMHHMLSFNYSVFLFHRKECICVRHCISVPSYYVGKPRYGLPGRKGSFFYFLPFSMCLVSVCEGAEVGGSSAETRGLYLRGGNSNFNR